jgi:hypothetical protein
VAHPEQPPGPPALGQEGGSQRLGGVDEIEVQTPVAEPGKRLIGERRQLLDAHRRVLLDANEVEVEVARVARGATTVPCAHGSSRSQTAACGIAAGPRTGGHVAVRWVDEDHVSRLRQRSVIRVGRSTNRFCDAREAEGQAPASHPPRVWLPPAVSVRSTWRTHDLDPQHE